MSEHTEAGVWVHAALSPLTKYDAVLGWEAVRLDDAAAAILARLYPHKTRQALADALVSVASSCERPEPSPTGAPSPAGTMSGKGPPAPAPPMDGEGGEKGADASKGRSGRPETPGSAGASAQVDGDNGTKKLTKRPAWRPFRRRRFFSSVVTPTDPFNWEEAWVRPSRLLRPWVSPLWNIGYTAMVKRNSWMPMRIQTPPLKAPKWAKGVGCSDAGAVFRAPWRLSTDQRVFRMNRAKRQGSVLIDTSGSMSLAREDVEMMVRAVPAAVVALYGARSDSGAVRVLAKWGRVVVQPSYFNPIGSHNGVDGPALHWLAHQPGPRVWISDGIVTGCGDQSADNLWLESDRICERYRITRVRTLAEALALL